MDADNRPGPRGENWQRAYRISRWVLRLSPFVAVFLLMGVPALAVGLIKEKDYVTTVVLLIVFPGFLLCAFVGLVAGVILLTWPCPRCGNFFHVSWERWYGNFYTTKCVHCGYRMQ
jgi:hypothetical protein